MLNQKGSIDQLRFLLILALSIVIGTLGPTPSRIFAQATSPVIKINAEAAKADITVEPLRGNLSVLFGSGGNIIVLNGRDGKLLVDSGIAVSRTKIQTALDTISQAPLKYVINTHWHWDHTDGNEWTHSLGATVIAQENTLKHMSVITRVEDWDHTFPAAPIGARPSVTFETDKTLKFDG
jgi:glyoxylase-like metal-dependent hydrolase (beta-lactamase superfamily II)